MSVASPTLHQLKLRARTLYKELQYLAREYPDPNYPIHSKLHSCFLAHVGQDCAGVQRGIDKAEYIKKELEMMYYLKKYRTMRKRYPDL